MLAAGRGSTLGVGAGDSRLPMCRWIAEDRTGPGHTGRIESGLPSPQIPASPDNLAGIDQDQLLEITLSP
jgi:hypothetical protein